MHSTKQTIYNGFELVDDDTIRVAVRLRIGASLHVQSAFMLPLWGTGRPLRHSRTELPLE